MFTDHADVRPTVMALVGLVDDYAHEGRVVAENLDPHVLPDALRDSLFTYTALAQAYKQINATKGPLGVNSLVAANQAITSNDATYHKFLTKIGAVTDERDALGGADDRARSTAPPSANQPIRFDGETLELIARAQLSEW